MTKVIVTGSDGFVGKHLIELLKKSNPPAGGDRIFGLDKSQADITNYSQIKKYLAKILAQGQSASGGKPDQVYHLAGFASGAGKDKALIFKVNVQGTINILKALKEIDSPVKIMLASTAYVYGNTSQCATENSRTDAKSFYDKSKLHMEKEARKYLSANIQIVISRATNHIGPGQKLGFVVPDFCRQIAKAKSSDTILVGNLSAKRDIFDVKDCVKAYKILMQKGKSGEIYNVGPGKPVNIKKVLNKLIKISDKELSYRIDPKLKRPSDITKNCVDYSLSDILINLFKTFLMLTGFPGPTL